MISNTNEAIEKGVCGAPTFEVVDVNGEIRLCWGQDRMNVLEDLLLGWNPEISKEKATVGKFVLREYVSLTGDICN